MNLTNMTQTDSAPQQSPQDMQNQASSSSGLNPEATVFQYHGATGYTLNTASSPPVSKGAVGGGEAQPPCTSGALNGNAEDAGVEHVNGHYSPEESIPYMNGDVGMQHEGESPLVHETEPSLMNSIPARSPTMMEEAQAAAPIEDGVVEDATPADSSSKVPQPDSSPPSVQNVEEVEPSGMESEVTVSNENQPIATEEEETIADESVTTGELNAVATQTPEAAQPTRDQIRQKVMEAIEYFFSRENWCSDHFLMTQMDGDQYVYIYVLANLEQFKSITQDHSIILEALKESALVQVHEDNTRVRPNYERCIVILREIPESTPVEEVEAIFKHPNCPKVVNVEFVHNSNWYITFESDNDAQKAYCYLRETVQTFRDRPILARIKTKPVARYGCLGVLPSIGGKGGPESKDQAVMPVPNAIMQPPPPGPILGPNNTPPPQGPYPNPRLYYPPNTAPVHNYYNTTAFFYPNPMVQWAGNQMYDLNSFIQLNRLTMANNGKQNNNRYPNRRPTKQHRYDNKNDPRTNNYSHGNTNSGGQRAIHHRQSPPASTSGNYAPSNTGSSSQSQNNSNNNQQPLVSSNSNNSYDISSSSNSNFNGANKNMNGVQGIDRREAIAGPSPPNSGATPPAQGDQQAFPLVPISSMPSMAIPTQPHHPNSMPGNMPIVPNAPSQPHQHHGPPPPPHQMHRNYNGGPIDMHHHVPHPAHHQYYPMPRDQGMPPRNQGRVQNRRRPSRPREDENSTNGNHSNNNSRNVNANGSNSRTGNSSATGNDNNKTNQNNNDNVKQPQFDLKASAFPPLPGPPAAGEEIVTAPVEEKVQEPSQNAWADVTKGTSKPKPPSISNDLSSEPVSTTSVSPPSSSYTSTESTSVTTTTVTTTSQASVPDPPPPTASAVVASTPAPVTAATTSTTSSHVAPAKVERDRNHGREQRGPREERRNNPLPITRREDRNRDIGGGRGRPNMDRRDRDNRSSAGNKENRPVQHSRPWRDERADAEGWITKGAKEPRGLHRNNQAHNYHSEKETKTPHLVNGDSSSPPLSPKPSTQTESKQINANSELSSEKEAPATSLNNNEGEHKTSYAKMALASKDKMPIIAAQIKEKEELEKEKQRRIKYTNSKPQMRVQEKAGPSRDRERDFKSNSIRREGQMSRDYGRGNPFDKGASMRPRDNGRPKSPK